MPPEQEKVSVNSWLLKCPPEQEKVSVNSWLIVFQILHNYPLSNIANMVLEARIVKPSKKTDHDCPVQVPLLL